MRRSGRWLLLPLLLLAGDVEAADPIRLEVDSQHRLVLSGLPPILDDPEITSQLTTGLTTTFAFRVEVRGESVTGGALVDVRYELWDEVFQVVVVGIDGHRQRHDHATLGHLAEWWRDLQLLVLSETGKSAPPGARVRVTLDVVPFSQAERDDTKRWFSEAVGGAGGSHSIDSPDDREDSLEQVFSVLMATSIQRRALTSFTWTVDVPRGGTP